MTELVDTHCHIQSAGQGGGEKVTRELWAKAPELTGGAIVAVAAEAGVTRLVCVGCDAADSRLAIDFVKSRENCWASIGIHPHEARHYAGDSQKLADFAKLVGQPKVAAVGECGFDFYYNHSPKADQAEVLKFQIELALEHDLPVIFHVREAFDDFWPVFDGYTGVRGVLHSYTDSAANLAKALERGLYIGINGIATFTKNPAQAGIYKAIPLENLLLETDSPFLAPHPHRGSVNQPKHLADVAAFLAGLRSERPEDLA
ncbi:MAG TPA: TatD family hydrolase, partial [Candidatus Saccharimonadales bacterium]